MSIQHRTNTRRMFARLARSRRYIAFLSLGILALFAFHPSIGSGQTTPTINDLPFTITPTTAFTFDPNGRTSWDQLTLNLVEGQEVTFQVTPKDTTSLSGASQLYLSTLCYCNGRAGVVSYTTKAGTGSDTKTNVTHMTTDFEVALPVDSLPIQLTYKGLRSSRLRNIEGDTPHAVGSTFAIGVSWQANGNWVRNRINGRILVSERSHSADDTVIRYVSFDSAADVMKGGTLTYQVRLTDKDDHPVNAAQDIHLVINSGFDFTDSYADPATPLVQRAVMIPMGSSATSITVPSLTGVSTRAIERVYLRAYLRDHPENVKFRDQYGWFDAVGKIVDGTTFRLDDVVYWGTEGDNMSVTFNVDGNVNVGAFVLRLWFQFRYSGPGRAGVNYADRTDFVGGHRFYDCTVSPTRRGRHVMNLPLLEDHTSDDRESFVMRLNLVSAPGTDGVMAGVPNRYGVDFAYGLILDRTDSRNASSYTSDCVAVPASSVVPSSTQSSQPLQSPISFSTGSITLSEGTSFSYDVTLNSDPGDQTVTVRPVSLDEAAIRTPAALLFTSANWNQPQSVVVTAETDADDEDDQVGIGHVIEGISGAPVGPIVFATVTEQPTLGLDLRQPTQRWFGDQQFFVYWMRLDRQPSADVEIELAPASDSSAVQLHTNSLSFTAENWDRYQIVVMTPIDATAGNRLKITHSSTSQQINSGESVSATVSGG